MVLHPSAACYALEIDNLNMLVDEEDADTVRKGIVVAGRKRRIAPEIR